MNILMKTKTLFKIRQSKIAVNQALTLKLGVTLVLTVTQVYVFVNLRQVTNVPPGSDLYLSNTFERINLTHMLMYYRY